MAWVWLVGMAILHIPCTHNRTLLKEMSTSASHIAPGQGCLLQVLYQGEAFFQVRVILFYSDLVCALWQRELQLQEHTHTHSEVREGLQLGPSCVSMAQGSTWQLYINTQYKQVAIVRHAIVVLTMTEHVSFL